MNGVTAIANILKMEGVDFIGCMPSNPLIEAAAVAGIRPIVFRQERTGVHMADGLSRISNGKRTGIFLMQAGPGSENAMGGVAVAYADSVPILLLPAGASRRRQGVHPVFNSTRSYESITKWSAQINFADRVPELMRQAFTKLRSGRPGPVLLEIPADVATEEISEDAFDYQPPQFIRTAADPEGVRRAARALLQAQRPVIQAGQGVLYAEATPELLEVAEFLQAPVYTTLPGKSAFPENHPLALGTGAGSTTGMVHHFLTRADLVFGIGTSFTKANTAAPIPAGKVLVHGTNDVDDINKDYASQYPLVGDAKLVLAQLLEELKRQGKPKSRAAGQAVQQELRGVKEQWLNQWMPKLTSNETPINPYRLINDMKQVLNPAETIITHDSGHPRDALVPFWEPVNPGGYIGWGKMTTLGASLGFAMGAKLARPEKTCVSFLGNAAFGMVAMDFETAVRERIPILVTLLNNSLLGGYSSSHPVASEKYNLNKQTGEYAAIAKAVGGYSEKVEKPEEIIPALRRAKKATDSGHAALLEFITREEGAFSLYR